MYIIDNLHLSLLPPSLSLLPSPSFPLSSQISSLLNGTETASSLASSLAQLPGIDSGCGLVRLDGRGHVLVGRHGYSNVVVCKTACGNSSVYFISIDYQLTIITCYLLSHLVSHHSHLIFNHSPSLPSLIIV